MTKKLTTEAIPVETVQAIVDAPAVNATLCSFYEDATNDNAFFLVRAIMEACRDAMLNHSGDSANMVKPALAVPDELVEEPGTWKTPDVVFGWNECRAAMLAQPVSQGCNWIACGKQLPAVGETVLVSSDGYVSVGESERSGANYRYFTSVATGRELTVTHWMPLPAAPATAPDEIEPDSIDKFVAQVCGDLTTSNQQ